MLYHPTLHAEGGDSIVASRELSWGHLTDDYEPIQSDDTTIEIEIERRADHPEYSDTFVGTINGEEAMIHIDLITDVFSLASSLTYER